MEEIHDHCRSCYNRYCDFDVVEDVSCCVIPCANDCGQKLHHCKKDDHDIICLNATMDCLNKQYGCPFRIRRQDLAKHLDVCPANVVICMMEWNRWHRGSLQSRNEQMINTKKLQNVPVLHRDLDIALALHDQRVLIETIMPSDVLQYYSDLADNQSTGESQHTCAISQEKFLSAKGQAILVRECVEQDDAALQDGASGCPDAIVPNGHDVSSTSVSPPKQHIMTNSNTNTADCDPHCQDHPHTTGVEKGESITNHLQKYVDVVKRKKRWFARHSRDFDHGDSSHHGSYENGYSNSNGTARNGHDDEPDSLLSDIATARTPESKSGLPYNGLFNKPGTESSNGMPHVMEIEDHGTSTSEAVSPHGDILSDIRHIDACIQEFTATAPHFMTLLNTLDMDTCDVIDVVDMLVSKVSKQSYAAENNSELGAAALDWNDNDVGVSAYGDQERHSDNLRRTISEMLEGFGVVCEMSLDSSNSTSSAEERRQRRRSERKKRSWLFSSGVTGGPLTAWGWNPKKETKDAATDTSDLFVDKSNLEWLSPEAVVSRTDLISRLFSIIGASYRGNMYLDHKQTTPFMTDSSSQTVAPFLLHLDMHAIGRALCSYSLTSSQENIEEREYILSLLSKGYTEKLKQEYAPTKISDNLAYHSMALESVVESVPRYQSKPLSMFSFMCGCVLRRDQFAAHVQNVHCEIMAGLNGWIEQKCPYAAFGCEYSQPRFCPNRQSDAVVFNQNQNCFAIKPDHWKYSSDSVHVFDSSTPSSSFHFLHLPYEVHERIFRFLDSVSMNQLSQTCTYLREVCAALLTSRGVVKTEWKRRTYEDGSQSWKMDKQKWSFTSSFTKINRWVMSGSPPMVHHLSRCKVASSQLRRYEGKQRFKIFGD